MRATIANNWQTILGTTAGVILVFAVSWLLFSSDQPQLVPDPQPEIIERQTFDVDNDQATQGARTPQGPVVISPATISVQNAAPGLRLPTINVQNQSSAPRRLQIDFAPFYRTTSQGVPVILSDAESIAAGRQYMQLQPSGPVTVPANGSLAITATLRSAPEQPTLLGSIGVTILGQASSFSDPERDGVRTRVQQNVRLTALVYAVFPGGSSRRYRVNNLQAESTGQPGSVRVTVEMRSEGDLPTETSGRVIITPASGGQAISRPLPPVTILPGQRATSSTVPINGLSAGKYRLSARVDNQRSGQQVSRALVIDRRGFPAVPRATTRLSIDRQQVNPGEDIRLTVRLKNSGTRTFTPQAEMSLYQTASSRPQARQEIDFTALRPDQQEDKTLAISAPQRPGSYIYSVSVANQSGEVLEERSVGLTVSTTEVPEISWSDRFRDWVSANPGAGLAVGAAATAALLLIILSIVHLVVRFRSAKDKY